MKASLLGILLLGASVAAPAIAAPPAQPGPNAAAAPWHDIPGVSAPGNATLKRLQGQPDPQLAGAIVRMRSLQDQFNAALNAPTLDVDKFAGLLRQREELNNTLRVRQDERVVAGLRQLSPADRTAFIRALTAPPPGMAPQR